MIGHRVWLGKEMEEASGSSIEMEEIIPGGPSRQPSLESQRQRRPSPGILRWLLGRSGVTSRPSGPVDDAIEAGAKAYRTDAQTFLTDFNHMSHRRKAGVQEIFDLFIRTSERRDSRRYCPILSAII